MTTQTTQRASGKRPAGNVLNAMATGPWAILPEKLDTLVQIALRMNVAPEAIEAERGEPLDHTYCVTVRDGIATIPIEGPLFKRADFFTRVSGATAYGDVAPDFYAALVDPAIRAIILTFDSEGGQVAGCSELARMIFESRGEKPIIAYVEGCCASAAYWLASACDEIVAADTALVGSIGCVLSIEITKKQDEMLGIEHIEIVSSQTPLKRADPTKPAGRTQYQTICDELAQVFIDGVAEYRDVDAQTVIDQYAGRLLYVGESAREAGLVDRLGAYEDLLSELIAEFDAAENAPSPGLYLVPAATAAHGSASASRPTTPQHTETAMKATPQTRRGARASAPASDTTDSTTTAPAAPGTPAPEPDDDDEDEPPAPAASASAGPAAPAATIDLNAVRAQAAAAERERVLAIQALGRAGEESIITTCVNDPACTPAMAALKLRQQETTAASQHLTALRGDESGAPAPTATASVDRNAVDAAEDAIVNAGKAPKADPASPRLAR